MFFSKALLQNEEKDEDESDDGSSDDDSSADYCNTKNSQTRLQRCDHNGGVNSNLPDTFQTSHLLFYERFKAYQDYMLGNCRHTQSSHSLYRSPPNGLENMIHAVIAKFSNYSAKCNLKLQFYGCMVFLLSSTTRVHPR